MRLWSLFDTFQGKIIGHYSFPYGYVTRSHQHGNGFLIRKQPLMRARCSVHVGGGVPTEKCWLIKVDEVTMGMVLVIWKP